MKRHQPIIVVQGGQWGSEAKGAVSLALCQREGVKYAVRTGSINAGHSVIVPMPHGEMKFAFQQLPVAAVLPKVKLVLGPGAYIHGPTLQREISVAKNLPTASNHMADRVIIDRGCGVHLDGYMDEAAIEGRNLKIGATGKGCAEAIIHKIKDRGVGRPLLFREMQMDGRGMPIKDMVFADTAEIINDAYDSGDRILIEGTQGSLLDLHTGPYPFTTSRQTTASAWVTEAGLSPALNYEVVLVVRTYPIRVAGNSGPMGREITWPSLARAMNERLQKFGLAPVVSEPALKDYEGALEEVLNSATHKPGAETKLKAATSAFEVMGEDTRAEVLRLFETTTVTKRLRRIAMIDVDQTRLTIKKERPAYVVLTFLNYVFPELPHLMSGLSADAKMAALAERKEVMDYVEDLQDRMRCWIKYITVGPRSEDMIETPGTMYRPR